MAKRFFRCCPISLPNIIEWLDLVERDMVDFNVIFGMD